MIIFMLVTGGFSPFYSRNQIKMQKRILRGNFDIEGSEFGRVSKEAKDLVRGLLVVDPTRRKKLEMCEKHAWVAGEEAEFNENMVRRLETQAMRRWLARRRWVRAVNMVRATIRLCGGLAGRSRSEDLDYFSQEEEIWI